MKKSPAMKKASSYIKLSRSDSGYLAELENGHQFGCSHDDIHVAVDKAMQLLDKKFMKSAPFVRKGTDQTKGAFLALERRIDDLSDELEKLRADVGAEINQ